MGEGLQANACGVRDLTCHFQQRCSAAKADSFEDLSELIIMEQFKNSIPQCFTSFVNEQKPTTALHAVELISC